MYVVQWKKYVVMSLQGHCRNSYRKEKLFIDENVVCEISPILSGGDALKH